jgi:hypothetical protein
MPAARFWEFEDARVDFGAVDAAPQDLARMLLVEFAITYGKRLVRAADRPRRRLAVHVAVQCP